MDLSQKKLSKSEWISIEISVSDSEKQILQLISDGYENPDIRVNDTAQSILSHLKIAPSSEMEYYLFHTYFETPIRDLITKKDVPKKKNKPTSLDGNSKHDGNNKHDGTIKPMRIIDPTYVEPLRKWVDTWANTKIKSPNKADMIRIDNMSSSVQNIRDQIFEFILLEFAMEVAAPNASSEHPPGYYAYSLVQLKKCEVLNLNPYVSQFVDVILSVYSPDSPKSIQETFDHASEFIEKNPNLIRYENRELYPHQKKLFRIFNEYRTREIPRLVLYMAPTGTGKTLSPIGLSQGYRVIFVCVARHVGLALAKSAISIGKRVAFAFGCETASDIRLHYFAAADYKINKRSGGIGKVDNTVGHKVEIIISDVASYLVAMRYMISFNNEKDIVTYWDEPTITMDYDNHDLHEVIHSNWSNNRISKMVLSCATLPKQWEIDVTIQDFRTKFEHIETPEIHTIDSYDCKKSLTLLDKKGYPVLPHLLFSNYADILRCVEHCEHNKSLLRYLDVDEIIRFVSYVCSHPEYEVESHMTVQHKFKKLSDITMKTVKQYYLDFMSQLCPNFWEKIHTHMKNTNTPKLGLNKIKDSNGLRKIHSYQDTKPPLTNTGGGELRRTTSLSITKETIPPKLYSTGAFITTQDAYTMTDGPTIFITEDVEKIGTFYLQQTSIPDKIFQSIVEKIERNNVVQRRITTLEKEVEDKETAATDGNSDKTKKLERDPSKNREMRGLIEQLETLKREIQAVSLPAKYIPNTLPHQEVWLPAEYEKPKCMFSPTIDETDVRDIMSLDVSNQKKLLLILGIGTFSSLVSMHENMAEVQYMEVMKRLAQEKRLFLIIASSDYIYGTNYQFSHGFIGKDLDNMTQQKTIQAIGRVGRNNIQQDYTIRFRNDEILTKLFLPSDENREAEIMSRLFQTDIDT